jgi:Ca2+-binding EF-hand superfamily protein
MEIINFNITAEEVLDIFRVLDNDCSGKISMKEL